MTLKSFPCIFALILMFASVGLAQKVAKTGRKTTSNQPSRADSLKEFKQSFISASEKYKASLQDLLSLYEADVKKQTERAAKWKELYDDGLISRQEYEQTSGDIKAAQVKVDETRKQIATTEIAIAEARREPSAEELRNAEMAALSRNAPPWTTGNARIDGLIRQNGARYGVDPYLIYCVIQQESSFNSGALSVKGAQGLMQLMPGTAARYGVTNPNDPAQNIMGGTRYLRDLLQLFHGRIDLVLAGYNAGEGAVIKYGQNVPPYKETKDYVRLISKRYLGNRTASSSSSGAGQPK
jgi:soluble lytic murein transglycosylase-like protein